MANPAIAFANDFDAHFRTCTRMLSGYEIPLFRAMHSTLVGLRGRFQIEEYHGNSRQVRFTGNGSHARIEARCELSDLMILVYSQNPRHVRLAYMQAKSERATPSCVYGHRFSANLEQWFLLSSRPTISGAGAFDPPPDLLSNAILSSIGAFVFFFRDQRGEFQIFYAAANHLQPPRAYSQKYGKLQAASPCTVTKNSGHTECLAACGNVDFAKSLYSMEIGTPVHGVIAQSRSTRNWLAANLRTHIQDAQETDRPSELAQGLVDLLEPEELRNGSGSFGAKNLVIIKSTVEPDNCSDLDVLQAPRRLD